MENHFKFNTIKSLSACVGLIVCLFKNISCFSQDYTQTQSRIKSIYTYNFMKDIDWPSFNKDGEVSLCLMERSSLYDELEKLTESRKLRERIIKIRLISGLSDCHSCDLIFLEEESLAKKIKRDDSCNSFVITNGFFEKSLSNIALIYQDKKLQFGINAPLCAKLGFKLSSNLSAMANQSITK